MSLKDISNSKKKRKLLSRETLDGIRFTGILAIIVIAITIISTVINIM